LNRCEVGGGSTIGLVIELMLRGSPELEELAVGGSGRVDEQLAAEGERAQFAFEAKAFELEGGANR
jgi:hypothetical protein